MTRPLLHHLANQKVKLPLFAPMSHTVSDRETCSRIAFNSAFSSRKRALMPLIIKRAAKLFAAQPVNLRPEIVNGMCCQVQSENCALRSEEMVLSCWSWPRCFKPLKLVCAFNVELI